MKMALKALSKENPDIFFVIFAFIFGCLICLVCYYFWHRILFKTHKQNSILKYVCCIFVGVVWGCVATNIIGEFEAIHFILACISSLCATFVVLLFARFIITPLPADIYKTKKILWLIRFIKVIFIASLALILVITLRLADDTSLNSFSDSLLVFLVIFLYLATPTFFILWGISYIFFGSSNPFFVFKYKENQYNE